MKMKMKKERRNWRSKKALQLIRDSSTGAEVGLGPVELGIAGTDKDRSSQTKIGRFRSRLRTKPGRVIDTLSRC